MKSIWISDDFPKKKCKIKSALSFYRKPSISRKILNWFHLKEVVFISWKINFGERMFDFTENQFEHFDFMGKWIHSISRKKPNNLLVSQKNPKIINMKNIPCRKSFHGKTFLISCLFTILFRSMETSPRSRFHGRWIRISKTRTQPFWKTHRKIALSQSRIEFSGFKT